MAKFIFNTISPTTYQKLNLHIKYAFIESNFGKCLVGITGQDGYICYLKFCNDESEETVKKYIARDWPNASVERDGSIVKNLKNIFKVPNEDETYSVFMKGTDLQIKVWKELAAMKRGSTVTYGDLAAKVGYPKAIRAVASAVSHNQIAYLIPCHRVIHKSKMISKYGGGPELKSKILNYEANIYNLNGTNGMSE